jgi:hypothetical protein
MRGKRRLTDADVLAVMRCKSMVELTRVAERLGIGVKYAGAMRSQLEPRSLRLAAALDIPKPPALPRSPYAVSPMRGGGPVTAAERDLIRRIMAGDE